jgi:hypothetical protein
MGYFVIIGVVFIVGYYLSLKAYPYRKCRLCAGTGRQTSDIHGSALIRCSRCGGSGRADRVGVRFFLNKTGDSSTQSGTLRRVIEDSAANAATALAGWIVDSKHAYLRDAWAADLYGDPDGARPTSSMRLRLAVGFVATAVWGRLHNATDLAWLPVDALLATSSPRQTSL